MTRGDRNAQAKGENMDENKIKSWFQAHPHLVARMLSLCILAFGLLAMIGALKDWDWLYAPDKSYHNKWTIGQISRYLGRDTARVLGFMGGLLISIAGGVWSYLSFFTR